VSQVVTGVDGERNGSAARELLGAEREAALTRIRAMTTEFDAIVEASSGANLDDEHDPEGSTVAFERAQVATLLIDARRYLDELDQAVARLDVGRYGLCERCRTPIGPERLAARPAARTCVDCAGSPRSDRGND
jgi:RNA polymerase-binding transcription factor DksA